MKEFEESLTKLLLGQDVVITKVEETSFEDIKKMFEDSLSKYPHWKKSSLPFKFPRIYNGLLVWDGYEISLNELKKLPKYEEDNPKTD